MAWTQPISRSETRKECRSSRKNGVATILTNFFVGQVHAIKQRDDMVADGNFPKTL